MKSKYNDLFSHTQFLNLLRQTQGEKRSNVCAGLRFDFSVLSRDVTKALQLDEKPGPEYSGAIWEN